MHGFSIGQAELERAGAVYTQIHMFKLFLDPVLKRS